MVCVICTPALAVRSRRVFARFARSGKRSDIFLATKFGIIYGQGHSTNGSPAHMRQQVARSLARLQTGMSPGLACALCWLNCAQTTSTCTTFTGRTPRSLSRRQ
jgi:hypothetical protein